MCTDSNCLVCIESDQCYQCLSGYYVSHINQDKKYTNCV